MGSRIGRTCPGGRLRVAGNRDWSVVSVPNNAYPCEDNQKMLPRRNLR